MHLFVDNLTNIDFSYLHPQRGVVGETWLASITLEGALDHQGMVCDFGIVKKTVRNWLDEFVDHCLLAPLQSPQLTLNTEAGNVGLHWQYAQSILICQSPSPAITQITCEQITPDSVAQWCIEQLRAQLPDTIDRIQLTFKPESIEHHFYHYSHGLKKHAGNCQRIAHGHRSTLEIYCNDIRESALEEQWCQQWQDIYIGSREDLTEQLLMDNREYYTFTYTAEQGPFELTLPASDCYLIDTDSTVELIAQHIANTLKSQQPNNHYTVRAFEGIGKGAIAFT